MRSMLLVSIVGLLLVTVYADSTCKQCGKNEEWTECGTACPKTCDKPEPQACTLQCVIGCQCKDGFVLNKNGHCVRPSQCCNSRG